MGPWELSLNRLSARKDVVGGGRELSFTHPGPQKLGVLACGAHDLRELSLAPFPETCENCHMTKPTNPTAAPPFSRANLGRSHPNHKERGPAKWYYTYEDIADLTGLKLASVYNARSRGEFDPDDFDSVIRFIAPRLRTQRLDREVKPEVQAEPKCQCESKRDGYSPVNRAFFCLTCGLETRRI